ncbi:MAG: hypothetical protein ACTSO9_16030 [Candidatus Helarchaeota archaeon]
MRKLSLILLGLIAGFSIIGLSPVITSNAQHPRFNFLAFYLTGLSVATEGSHYQDYGGLGELEDYYVAITGNNIAFAWGTRLKRLTASTVSRLAHGWVMLLGVSKYAEMRESPFWYFSVSQLKSVGSIFPGVLEAYNDSNGNGVCDTFFNFSYPVDNSSEVKYYLHLLDYGSVEIMNLTPTQDVAFRPYQEQSFTWGVNYTNVDVRVYDATTWATWPSGYLGQEMMDYLNISYTLKFHSDGSNELFQNLHFGEITNNTLGVSWTGLGLSVIQFDVAQTLDLDLKINVDARNENGTIQVDPENTTVMTNFTMKYGTQSLMELDLTSSKPEYIWNQTDTYNVTAVSVPWFTTTYSGYVEDQTYSHTGNWKRVREWFQHRICYNKWEGEEIDHDPIFLMTAPTPFLFNFDYNPKAWMPSAVIGGIFAAGAGLALIGIIVNKRRK